MMADLTEWLDGLGLGKYATDLAEQEIEFDHLHLLTEADVKELGLPIGPRRKLLEAIATLRTAHDARLDLPQQGGGAERRQLTVMFVDLADSTPLALDLDPEAMRDVLRAFQNTVAVEIGRLGFIAKLMGDGVLAYFGWPRAHEDDATRAVAVALAIVDAVAQLRSPGGDHLACRIGIATGLVVVGDLVGERAAQEHLVVGPTPNLAARLQEVAGPGEVMISNTTRRLLGAEFAIEDMGERRLKGHALPVTLFRVIQRETSESRFAARCADNSVPIFGRDVELALLQKAWSEAVSGQGQTVLMTGEAGIGKSRLLQALDETIATTQPTRYIFQCSPLHIENPFWPVVSRFAPAGPIVVRGMKADRVADQARAQNEVISAIAEGLQAASRPGPAMLVFEDAQWADQATLNLIRNFARTIDDTPALLLITGRPEAEPRFDHITNLIRLSLARLDHSTAKSLIAAVAEPDKLAPRLLGDILARSDGIPLFLEEMTRAVIDTTHSGTAPSVPATLHDSLLARLDVAPAMKAVAQVASCIGRDFDEALLMAIGDIDPSALRQGLMSLLQAGLVVVQPGGGFRFKHALLSSIAYETLLIPRRQRLHRAIAEAIEAMPGDPAEHEPESLAHHWYAAGENRRAEPYWLRAQHRVAHWQGQLDALANFLDNDVGDIIPFQDAKDRRKLH